MQWILNISGALVLLAAGAAAHAADGIPPGFEARYAVYSKGARIARMERHLTHLADGGYRYRSETRAAGFIALFRDDQIIEESTWALAGGTPRPLSYAYQRTGGDRERAVAITFDWDTKRITNTINGDSWQMPTAPKVMDKLMYQLAVMYDLNRGMGPLDYTIADGGKIKEYRFERLGEEVLSTDLGEFQTVKLERHKDGSDQQMILWCARNLHFLPVRVETIEEDGDRSYAVLESVSGLGN